MTYRIASLTLIGLFSIIPGISASQSSEWRYQENIHPMTDEDKSFAATGTGRNTLVIVRCDGSDGVDVFVGVGEYLGNGTAHVAYRFDEEDPVDAGEWNLGTEGNVAFAPQSMTQTLIDGFRQGSRVVFQITKFNGSQPYSEFSLSGSAAAISQLGCMN
jgi:hypothetical protein